MKETKNYHERPREHRNNDNRRFENRPKRNSFFRAGQVFSFIYHITSLGLIYLLVQDGEQDLAFKLLLVNAGLVVFALILAAVERKLNPRPKGGNRGGRKDNRHRRPPHRN